MLAVGERGTIRQLLPRDRSFDTRTAVVSCVQSPSICLALAWPSDQRCSYRRRPNQQWKTALWTACVLVLGDLLPAVSERSLSFCPIRVMPLAVCMARDKAIICPNPSSNFFNSSPFSDLPVKYITTERAFRSYSHPSQSPLSFSELTQLTPPNNDTASYPYSPPSSTTH